MNTNKFSTLELIFNALNSFSIAQKTQETFLTKNIMMPGGNCQTGKKLVFSN